MGWIHKKADIFRHLFFICRFYERNIIRVPETAMETGAEMMFGVLFRRKRRTQVS